MPTVTIHQISNGFVLTHFYDKITPNSIYIETWAKVLKHLKDNFESLNHKDITKYKITSVKKEETSK